MKCGMWQLKKLFTCRYIKLLPTFMCLAFVLSTCHTRSMLFVCIIQMIIKLRSTWRTAIRFH